MKVILAKKAGFCMGVRRAVETTLETVQQTDKKITTFGPLIHNPQVLSLLEERGVEVLSEIPEQHSGVVIVRAHGVPPGQKASLKKAGAEVKDATCPRVVKVQAIIKRHKKDNCFTVIVGDKNHAEVIGLMGYAEPDVAVVSNKADVAGLDIKGPYIIVSQTTQDDDSFAELSELITSRFANGKVFNTICDSTHKRQNEVRTLCDQVEAVVVVGGKASANTKRLAEIAENKGLPVFLVETEADLDFDQLRRFETVGVTAGASTPTWMINRVMRTLEAIQGREEGGFCHFCQSAAWALLASNSYVSVGGGFLALAFAKILSGHFLWQAFAIAFGYLFAMHNINRFSGEHSRRFNDPLLEKFADKFGSSLLALSYLMLVGVGTLLWKSGNVPFLLFFAMAVLGIFYRIPIFPDTIARIFKIKRLKEIPGSKTFLVALAWAMATVVLPNWGSESEPATLLVLLGLVLVFIYVRNALFDVFDVQGDRIVGKETLPVCIGEEKTIFFLTYLLYALFGAGIVLPLTVLLPKAMFFFLPGVAYLLLITKKYQAGGLSSSPRLEFQLETSLYLVALALLLGSYVLT
ncbi:MAG: 4-hydroxy-3-methylbut-2-enyl diphosphate reductase [Thermodesulfobacteriota bacterium]